MKRIAWLLLPIACFALILCACAPLLAQSTPTPDRVTSNQYTLPPDKLTKSEALYTTRIVVNVIDTLWGFVVLFGLLKLGAAARLSDWADSLTSRRWLRTVLVAAPILFLIAVLAIPIGIYSHHVSLQYGLSVQHWGSWFWDWTKGELISLAMGTVGAIIFYAIVRGSPKRWWLYSWLIAVPVMLFLVFLAPVVLDPVFNKFEPLEKTNPALVQQIERVTARAGLEIPPDRMFEMKASEKVTTYNAYVTGFGATKRVVVWDNTERDLTTPETLFVFGHEMGHYVLQHIWKGMAFAAGLMFVVLWLGSKIMRDIAVRWGEDVGIQSLADPSSLPLFLLVFSLLGFFAQPAASGFSRFIEHQADIYGLEVTHGLFPNSSETAAISFQKLGEKSLSYPYPNRLLVFWMYDHPPISERLPFALAYRPWDHGQLNKYVK